MVRPLRIQYEGAFYHVLARGNEKKDIFRNDSDRDQFIQILATVVKKYRWIVHAYCLMNNHYHLVTEIPLKNLSTGMRQLNGVYSQNFNKKYTRVGHLFQGRFKSHLIEKEIYLLEVCRYIVLNPVRAGLVRDVSEWEYSSYGITCGARKNNQFLYPYLLLSFFSDFAIDAQKKYDKFIREGKGIESPFKKAYGGIILGSENFRKKVMSPIKNVGCKEIVRRERYVNRPDLKEIFLNRDRDEGIAIAINRWGYCLRDVGSFAGLHYSWVSRIAKKAKNKT